MEIWLVFFFLQSGNIIPVSVKEGDKVLLPEYGGTKINLDEKVIYLLLDWNDCSVLVICKGIATGGIWEGCDNPLSLIMFKNHI